MAPGEEIVVAEAESEFFGYGHGVELGHVGGDQAIRGEGCGGGTGSGVGVGCSGGGGDEIFVSEAEAKLISHGHGVETRLVGGAVGLVVGEMRGGGGEEIVVSKECRDRSSRGRWCRGEVSCGK